MGKTSMLNDTFSSLTGRAAPTPIHFFSHGSTMMLGEESSSADYWKKCGDDALANGIKGVVMMVQDSVNSSIGLLLIIMTGRTLGCSR